MSEVKLPCLIILGLVCLLFLVSPVFVFAFNFFFLNLIPLTFNLTTDKIRVLIVDDSFFVRKLVRGFLSTEPEIEIIGEARNGHEAVEKAEKFCPRVILMDYLMPEMNGLETIEKILSGNCKPLPAIIMLSAFTEEGAEATLESLRAGAVDFIQKPSGEISLDIEKIKDELVSKIKAASRLRVKKFRKLKTTFAKKQEPKKLVAKIIVIGASTGGPPILENIFTELPANLRASFLIVQHMPKNFTRTFAQRLNNASRLEVKEGQDGDEIKTNTVFVAPGDWQMMIAQKKESNIIKKIIHLTKEAPSNNYRPSIDVLMQSVAQNYSRQVIGIVLTGMGEDGLKGIRAIKEAGGYTIVQDPKTSVIDSMPQKVIEAGLADEVLAPEKIAKRLIQLVGGGGA